MKPASSKIVLVMILILMCSVLGFARNNQVKRGPLARDSAPRAGSCPLPAQDAKDDPGQPVATVAGEPIYERDLAGAAGAQMLQVRKQEYEIKKKALDDVIRRKVVEVEAKKRGVSVDKLYQEEVDSKISDPSDAEARGYYFAVKSQTTLPFDDIKPQLKRLLKTAEVQQARQDYAESLRAKTEVVVLLRPPTVEVGYSDPARVRGEPRAPVTIVEFSDFQCPFCKRVEPTLKALLAKYNGRVKVAFRDFPLSSIHPHAQMAAEAGRCAEEQGKFWEYHDAMFADQSKLDQAGLEATAKSLGLDEKGFVSCLTSGRFTAAIDQDVQDGTKAGVSGTPGFFINGQFVSGSVPAAQFEKIIDSELAAIGNGHPGR